MTDYLGQLVLRVRQPDLSVQPRVRSRFESPQHVTLDAPDLAMAEGAEASKTPPPATTLVDDTTTGSTRQDDRPDSPDLPHPSAPPHRRAAVPTLRIGEVTDHQSVAAPRIGRDPGRPPDREVQRPVVARDAAPAEHPAQRGGAAAGPRMPVDMFPDTAGWAPAGPRGVELLVTPINRVVQGSERSVRPEVRAQPDRPEAARSDSHSDRDWPSSGARVELRPPSATGKRRGTEVFRPPVTPAIAFRDEGRSQVPDEPAIQVTIGRVEIRATVAPVPVRKPAGRPPAMSLDEYLKQRNEASK